MASAAHQIPGCKLRGCLHEWCALLLQGLAGHKAILHQVEELRAHIAGGSEFEASSVPATDTTGE